MVNFVEKFNALITPLPAEPKFEIISGQADCQMTMYCRVRLSCVAKETWVLLVFVTFLVDF